MRQGDAPGNYFEDFLPGDCFHHWPAKTVQESDNNLFCLLTMNHHPVHLDEKFCTEEHLHGRILVVGTYVLSLAVGMSVRDISALAIANLSYHDVQHHEPVFVGDTLRAMTEVKSTRPSDSKPDRGIVTVKTRVFNQGGTGVLSFERSVLIPRRP
ncbi:MAG TPA: dehydratase [Acidimicrobiaceae bacterium]|nr:dehydratase [Acidimicrobiaceae bacterium]|tara:strand:+ start:112 stop:576 length:465 start_codon:yes stop_codon:yes gene_type:complete